MQLDKSCEVFDWNPLTSTRPQLSFLFHAEGLC